MGRFCIGANSKAMVALGLGLGVGDSALVGYLIGTDLVLVSLVLLGAGGRNGHGGAQQHP